MADSADRLAKVHKEALDRFDAASQHQLEIRDNAIKARRFVAIPGEMWKGPWGEQFENGIRIEIPKIQRAIRKIENDYRQNRVVPSFRPDGGEASQETADTLAGLHRADSYRFRADQARFNAFSEMLKGGFGAYRLTNVLEDEYDPDNDHQRVNPAMLIVDADQRVYFDPNDKSYDKRDSRYAFVITAYAADAFKEEFGDECATDWPDSRLHRQYDWFTPKVVKVAEYYRVEIVTENRITATFPLSAETQSFWESELEDDDRKEMKALGWRFKSKPRKRKRVCKFTLSGAEVLRDDGYIAGCEIPIVPVYAYREFIDNQEWFKGHVHDRMDSQRLYNAKASKFAEIDALAPREVPLVSPEQIPPGSMLAEQWADQNIKRYPFLYINPLLNEDGSIASAGPLGTLSPPQLQPVTALLMDIANRDLTEDDVDDAQTVKANTSEDAMNIAAARIDAKSGIFLDNMRLSVEREAEIYLGMASEVYFEPGRTLDTMTEDGDDGEVTLSESKTMDNGEHLVVNDFSRGRYKVIASVTEATATRKDKTVRSALQTAEIASQVGDQELAQAALITAVMNQDGEGMSDFKAFARKRALAIGLVEPNDEEKKQAEEQAQNQQPDPTMALQAAQAQALQASAAKDVATIEKIKAETAFTDVKAKAAAAGVMIEAHKVEAVGAQPVRMHVSQDQSA